MAFCRELGEVAFLPEETERDDQLMSFRFVGRKGFGVRVQVQGKI